jgi:N-methylhydantoinase B
MRRIAVELRQNCVAGIPVHPTSCSAATTNIADRVANAVQAAFAVLADGAGMAECGASSPPASGVISGTDPRTGRPFVNQVFLGRSCGAAGPAADAWQTVGHVGNAGMCFIDSVELDELRFPLHIRARGFLPDTEAAGRTCGARIGYAIFGPRGGELDVIYNSDGNLHGPQGVRGGADGACSRQYVLNRDGREVEVPQFGRVTLREGEFMCSFSCGGGAYGPAFERPAEAVAKDVGQGFVSVERARSVYGVVTDEAGTIDAEATRLERARRESEGDGRDGS